LNSFYQSIDSIPLLSSCVAFIASFCLYLAGKISQISHTKVHDMIRFSSTFLN
jgi:hypothetical protein